MLTIKANVGRRPHRQCMNRQSDQITVMTLLNRIPEQFGGTEGKLVLFSPAGSCRDELYEGILRFQKSINMQKPDGIVEPNGITMTYLNRLADANLPPQKFLTDWAKKSKAQEIYTDARIAAAGDRIDMNAPEVVRAQKQKENAATRRWNDWKNKINHEAAGNKNLRDVREYLSDLERKGYVTKFESPILGEAIGFGGAWLQYGPNGDWNMELMFGEAILRSYDSRHLTITTTGLDKLSPPIILFSNFTHLVMKKNQTVQIEVTQGKITIW